MSNKEYKFSKAWYVVGVLLAANLTVWSIAAKAGERNYVMVNFFDVGQGDAIYIRTPQGNYELVLRQHRGIYGGGIDKNAKMIPDSDERANTFILEGYLPYDVREGKDAGLFLQHFNEARVERINMLDRKSVV